VLPALQTIHDLTAQLGALEVASMTEKEKFIDQCEELTAATRWVRQHGASAVS
jgi:hypothetical protein